MGLKIKVVKAAKKINNCGSAESKVKWILSAGDTGWVIQHLKLNHNVLKCDNTPDKKLNRKKLEFWEAWRVEKGKVFIGRTASAHGSDTFRVLDHYRRKKKHSATGKVKFIAGYNLTVGKGPGDWKENDVPAAGSLPTRRTKPTGWKDAGARDHNLEVEWNCCKASPDRSKVTSTPAKSDKEVGKVSKSLIFPFVSVPAKRVTKHLHSSPSWINLQIEANNEIKILYVLRRIGTYPTDVIRGGIKLFIYQCKKEKSYSLEEQSKVYLLNRYLFQLPRSVPRQELRFFGGWITPELGKTANPSWPLVYDSRLRLVIKGKFGGYMGDEYRAIEEFDYFSENYSRRKLKRQRRRT